MAQIPLINPALLRTVQSVAGNTSSQRLIQAEVTESVKQSGANTRQSGQQTAQTTYETTLKIGSRELKTVSDQKWPEGTQLLLKVQPGPQLKIIAPIPAEQSLSQSAISNTPAGAPPSALISQLLASRIPLTAQEPFLKTISQLNQLLPGNIFRSAETPPGQIPAQPSSAGQKASAENTASVQTANIRSEAPITQSLSQRQIAQLEQLISASGQTNPKPSAVGTQATTEVHTSSYKAIKSAPLPDNIQTQLRNWIQNLPAADLTRPNSTHINVQSSSTATQAAEQAPTQANAAQTAQTVRQALFSTGIFPESALRSALNSVLSNTGSTARESVMASSSAPLQPQANLQTTAQTLFRQLQQSLSAPLTAKENSAQPPATDLSSILNRTAEHLSSGIKQLIGSQSSPALQPASSTPLNPLTHLLLNPGSDNKSALSGLLLSWPTADTESPALFIQRALPDQAAPAQNNQLTLPLSWPDREPPHPVFRLIQNLLGHIEQEQIRQSLQPQEQPSQQWFPLILNHQQQLHGVDVYVGEKETENNETAQQKQWHIHLHFDLAGLGNMAAELIMTGDECSATFWSESAETLQSLSAALQPLRKRLSDNGVLVNELQVRHGTLARQDQSIQQRLVDVRT